MAEATVCVFAKPPEPGKAKTRLAASIGRTAAAELAEAFLRDTVDTVRRIEWAGLVIAATEPFVRDYLDREKMWIQPQGSLDVRMETILRRALLESPVAVALGADSPGLPVHRMEQARAALGSNDVVLGPCADGGFYLIGMKQCPEGLLSGIEWSRPTTLEQTVRRVNERGFSVSVLQAWFDIDTAEDLAQLKNLLGRNLIECPHTRRALEKTYPQPAAELKAE